MPAILAPLPRALRGAALPDAERTQVLRPAFPGRALAWDDVLLANVLPQRAELPEERTAYRPRPGYVASVAYAPPAPPVASPRPTPKARAAKAPLAPWLAKPTGKARTGREYLAAYWRKAFPAPLPATRPATLPTLLAHPAWAGSVAAPITPAMVHAAEVRLAAETVRYEAALAMYRADRCTAHQSRLNDRERDVESANRTLSRLRDPRAVRYVHPSGAELIHVPQD